MKRMIAVVLILFAAAVLTCCGKTGESGKESRLTDEQAVDAVKSVCYRSNPELEGIVSEGTYPVYWSVDSSDDDRVTVLFRSYTGAQIRYYIDRVTGETYVTEYVSGITPEEERTDESLNMWDYIK